MKKILRLLIAAGLFQALLLTSAAVYWLAKPAVEGSGFSLQALWGGFPLDSPPIAMSDLSDADAVPGKFSTAAPGIGSLAQLETSVAATLAHLPPADAPSKTSPTTQPLLFPTASITSTSSATVVSAQSVTVTPTSTDVPLSATNTLQPSATATQRPSATLRATATRTPRPTSSPTRRPTLTATPTASASPTASTTGEPTSSPTSTATPQPATATPTSSGPQPTPTVDLSGCDYNNDSSFENEVLMLLNQERAAVGLPPLAMQSQLRSAAREHSADMACNNFVSHTGSNGTSSYDRITSYGYYPTWWGENIYKGWRTTPEEVVAWWMNSTPHRNNILHSYYTHIGIGYIRVGDSAAYTLNFGRR